MRIVITRTDSDCHGHGCPAVGHVEGLPGHRLVVGKRPEELLDADALAQLAPRVGPDEYAVLIPEELLQ